MNASNGAGLADMGAGKCSIPRVQEVLGGKWKIVLVWAMAEGPVRFGELRRMLGGITESTLTRQLRELERDGMIHREVFREVPPHVEYSLTPAGEGLVPVLHAMDAWGRENLRAGLNG